MNLQQPGNLRSWAWCLLLIGACSGCQHRQAAESLTQAGSDSGEPEVAETWIQLQPGLVISPSKGEVVMDAEICLRDGWLEQVVCSPGTREHESIMVTRLKASAIHAALLAAGFEPGRPGRWQWEGAAVSLEPPEGSALDILVTRAGEEDWGPVAEWITDAEGRSPVGYWVFGGSAMRDASSVPAGVSLYEADLSGSVIGLVTFGDETLGFNKVIPDEVAASPEEWRVRSKVVPEVGTAVKVRIRLRSGSG